MEKRIKIVWMLTLITAFLMIGGQAYWLYNQYGYSVDEYMSTLHQKLVVLEREELEKRYAVKKIKWKYSLDYMIQLPDSINSKGRTFCTIIFTNQKKAIDSVYNPLNVDTLLRDALSKKCAAITFPSDSGGMAKADTFRVENVMFGQINEATSSYQTQLEVPFTIECFDSLLQANRIEASDIEFARSDTFQWESSYVRAAQFFPPAMNIVYPYNPFKKEVAKATIILPLNPLIRRMGWQLIGSACLLILLVFCLIYQIKTILKQRRIDELRKSFVNTMIHELKRPVQTLKMCVSFLNNKTMRYDEQAMDGVVQDAMFEIDNLSAYLAKVRDMTRADYEKTPLNFRTFDLKETIERLIRLSNIPTGKTVDIHADFDMDTTLVTADPVHIANIVNNLIENAIKYSSEDVSICVECRLHSSQLTVAVSDNGIGIPASEQERVFDKFYRAGNLPDHSLPGIGLGLSYVKLLTEAHCGTVSLSSRMGKGTVIVIQIPQ